MAGGALVVLAGCGGGSSPIGGRDTPQAAATMALTSPAFADGGVIPDTFTFSSGTQCTGANWSPPLNFANVPASAVSLALTVTDLDAGGFVHWKAWGLSPKTTGIAANETTQARFSQGSNGFGSTGWAGPCPPDASNHRYLFTLWALNSTPVGEPSLATLNATAVAAANMTGLRASTSSQSWNYANLGSTFAGNGWYWDPGASGTGLMFEAQNGSGFAAVFMYDSTGKPIWYAASGTMQFTGTGYAFQGTLNKFTGGQSLFGAYAAPVATSVGTLSISFAGNGNATKATVSLPGGRVWNTQRYDFNGLDTSNTTSQPEVGWFWNAAQSGRGYAIEVQNGKAFIAMFHYNADGTPTWNVVNNTISAAGAVASSMFQKFQGGQTLTGSPVSPTGPTSDGNASLSFSGTCNGVLTVAGASPISMTKYTFGGLSNGFACRTRTNTVPVANAGANAATTTRTLVTLDASASSDADSDALSYAWTLSSRPTGSNAILSSATALRPTFTPDVAGDYVLTLVVNDGHDASAPVSKTVTAAAPADAGALYTLQGSKTSPGVHLLILGDGFKASELGTFHTAAATLAQALFTNPEYAEHRDAWNVHALDVVSVDSGVNTYNVTPKLNTALGAEVGCFAIARLLCVNTSLVQAAALKALPQYTQLVVIANTTVYAGGGGVVAATSMNSSASQVVIHEVGHSFAGLADEYVDEAIKDNYSYSEGAWPNVTTYTNPAQIPWRLWLDSPMPTVLGQSGVGLFEGAYYRASGFYRPTTDSIMRSLGRPVGPVNGEAWIKRIYSRGGGLKSVSPAGSTLAATAMPAGGWVFTAAPVLGPTKVTSRWYLNGVEVVSLQGAWRYALPTTGPLTVRLDLVDLTSRVRGSNGVVTSNTWNVL